MEIFGRYKSNKNKFKENKGMRPGKKATKYHKNPAVLFYGTAGFRLCPVNCLVFIYA